jgi:alpha-glucosidase
MRRALLLTVLVFAGAPLLAVAEDVVVQSPGKKVELRLGAGKDGRLVYGVRLGKDEVVATSPLGILVDGVDLGQGAQVGKVERYALDEKYPWRGVHAQAVNRVNGARVPIRTGRAPFTIEVRVSDDAAAFRFLVPGSGRRVPDAATAFRLPAGSTVWYHGPRDHYEGLFTRKALADVPKDEWVGVPLTYKLPGDRGYASITEAALRDYAGMTLQADGQGGLHERLGHAAPASYPYTLRYREENAKRLAVPAPVEGPITTPWRVVILARDLNTLVNSDAVHNLAPAPDPKLFPAGLDAPWLRPGRAVWRYLDGGESTFEGIKEFSRLAGELGFEYQVVEGQWRRWTDEQVQDLVAYSKERKVGILVWLHSRDHREEAARRTLFARLQKLGVAGIKIDFLDHEARELIDLYQAILKDAAEHQLLVNFHGANKPAGESRTWPNEITREGVRGLEYGKTEAWAAHNTTIPFTRYLAGPGDYTPLAFGERRKETTWAHQIATLAVFNSPLMVYGAHPKSVLENPAADVIKSLPSVWDETIVLPDSAIGEVAAFARRSGDRWYLAVLNGPAARTLRVRLGFLGPAKYRGSLVRDTRDNPAAVEVEQREATSQDSLEIVLPIGGGFVGRFSR